MKTIKLGSTGLTVSALGFGGIPITRLTDGEAASIVRAALDAGITFIDTAWSYPHSEERIALALGGFDRSRVVLATKDGSSDGPMFRRHVEESLARLGVEVIDIIQFHNVSDEPQWTAVMAPGGAYEAACRLRDEGLARHIGITSHNLDIAAMAVDTGKFETLQVPINFVADDAEFLIERCRQKGLGFIAMKPFAGGELEDGELALRYFQQFPTVVPIPGIERMEELQQAIAIFESPRPLTGDERTRMAQLKREMVKVFCRGCGYCMPCPHGLAIPIVLRSTSFVKRMPAAWANRMFNRHMPKVDDCVECGECIKKCPYKLPIPEMLRQKRAWYDEWSKTLPPEETKG